MRYFTIFSFLIFLLANKLNGQTQSEMNIESSKNLKNAEKKLDTIYKEILKLYSNDTVFLAEFKTSQRYWSKYYIFQIKAMFPDYSDSVIHYGSMKSLCVTTYAKKIVEMRISELEPWLIGRYQGDCGSSIKMEKYLPEYKKYISTDSNIQNE